MRTSCFKFFLDSFYSSSFKRSVQDFALVDLENNYKTLQIFQDWIYRNEIFRFRKFAK